MSVVTPETSLCAPGRPDFALDGNVVLHRRATSVHPLSQGSLYLQQDPPHWFAAEESAGEIFLAVDGHKNMDDIVESYRQKSGLPWRKAFWHVQIVLLELLEKGLLYVRQPEDVSYSGRQDFLALDQLQEMWIHTNQHCNLQCAHCLVQSSPDGDRGADTATIRDWMQQGHALGVRRFFFTGGEPFARPDIIELMRIATVDLDSELIIITNGTLFSKRILKALAELPAERLRLQVSLDGTTAATNDAIRGDGVFAKVQAMMPAVQALGIQTALTFVPLQKNRDEWRQLPDLARELGVDSIHLMWPHRRGAMAKDEQELGLVDPASMAKSVLELTDLCEEQGVDLDNYGALLYRINGQPQLRYDLANAGWDSLFVHYDGTVYPTAVFAGESDLACGNLADSSLQAIWKDAAVLQQVRSESAQNYRWQDEQPLRWLIGGGDLEQIWYAGGKKFCSDIADPWYPAYAALAWRAINRLSQIGSSRFVSASGFDAPQIFHCMGDGSVNCGTEGYQEGVASDVKTLHSNCVLSFDVEKPRSLVRDFYGAAAEEPQEALCCPVSYDPDLVGHIPKDVIDRFYGCGSPVGDAAIQPGERTLDLGSGAGIDVFTAARLVGPQGKAIGVDMTDQMLAVAYENKPIVADNLGYDVVEFHKGFLESMPLEDRSVDLITSNCVVNLSPDKSAVFAEMWRVLDSGGRFCISDIVSEKRVPPHLRVNAHLWGECLSGALTERELYISLIKAGFYGLRIHRKSYWKDVEDFRFYSVTISGYKIYKSAGCVYCGQKAVYRGPFAFVTDEEGHVFPRGEEVDICTDTAQKLSAEPYRQWFTVLDTSDAPVQYDSCCTPDSQDSCDPSSGCC